MANTIVKRQYTKLLNANNDLEIEHFETDADIVLVDNSSGHYGGSATNAQSAFEELYNRNEVGYVRLETIPTSLVLTSEQLAECLKPFAILDCYNVRDIYIKTHESNGIIIFSYFDTHFYINNGYYTHMSMRINVNKSTGAVTVADSLGPSIYTRSQADTLLSGKQPTITDGSATIASESNGVVTLKAGVSQSSGAISNSSGSDITLGTAAKKGVATTVDGNSTDSDLATAKAVYDAIEALPEPMVFKGTLGTHGTITSLPTPNAYNEGYTYKVITAGNYSYVGGGELTLTVAAEIGDVVTSDGTAWVLIPAGDDVEDTWRPIEVNGTIAVGNGLSSGAVNFKNGTGTTVSYDSSNGNGIKYSLEDNYGDTKNPYASKTKNYVLAAPSSADGVPSFRALVAADLPDLSGTYQPLDADLTKIAGLTGTSGILKKTAAGEWALDTNTYITGNQTITVSGDATGSGTTSIALTLANSGVTAGTYTAVTVNAKGLVTAGAQTIEFGTSGQSTPSASLAVGGIFLKMI